MYTNYNVSNIVTVRETFGSSDSGWKYDVFTALNFIQFALSLIVLVFSTIERYPVSLFSTHFGAFQQKILERSDNIKFEQDMSFKDKILKKLGFAVDFEVRILPLKFRIL